MYKEASDVAATECRIARKVLISLTNQAASALGKAQLYGKLGARERALQDLVGKLLGAQGERRRVAYEEHDGLAQVASDAHQHLQVFSRRYSPEAGQGQRDLERIVRLIVRATVSDSRRIIANLRPTTLDDLGSAAAISLQVERLGEEGYQVDHVEGLGKERLPNAVEIALFRVAQEALTNVRKHARPAGWASSCDAGKRPACGKGSGTGIHPTAQPLESGPGERVGLAGMRERVACSAEGSRSTAFSPQVPRWWRQSPYLASRSREGPLVYGQNVLGSKLESTSSKICNWQMS